MEKMHQQISEDSKTDVESDEESSESEDELIT